MSYKRDESFAFHFRQIMILLINGLEADFKKEGVHLSRFQWAVLNILWDGDGLSQKEIAATMDRDKVFATRVLDELEGGGWIIRQACKVDRRKKLVFLTDKAKCVKEPVRALAYNNLENAKHGIRETEWTQFMNTLLKLRRNLENRS